MFTKKVKARQNCRAFSIINLLKLLLESLHGLLVNIAFGQVVQFGIGILFFV